MSSTMSPGTPERGSNRQREWGGGVDAETQQGRNRLADAVIVTVAMLVAVISAQPSVDSSNDGSRLAAVEALVDHHSLAIDESVFVDGTIDKIKVGGHFYSDKPYTLSLYLAGWYWLLQQATGLEAREQVARFCRWLTLLSSGLAYVAAVWSVYRMGRTLGL